MLLKGTARPPLAPLLGSRPKDGGQLLQWLPRGPMGFPGWAAHWEKMHGLPGAVMYSRLGLVRGDSICVVVAPLTFPIILNFTQGAVFQNK